MINHILEYSGAYISQNIIYFTNKIMIAKLKRTLDIRVIIHFCFVIGDCSATMKLQ